MLRTFLAYLALFSSTVLSESLRSASPSNQRELTSTCGTGVCYLYDIQKGARIKALNDNYDKRYQVAPIEGDHHKGYSIECDFDKSKVDSLKWYFPDGKKNYREERHHPYWLNGDDNGKPFYVEWMGQSGYKYIKLEAYDKNKNVCFRKTFELDAYCPSGYYDWNGHCYKRSF